MPNSKQYTDWSERYYELTTKGRKAATLKQQLIRGSVLGALSRWKLTPGGLAVMSYFRKWKTTPRSLNQIWNNLPFGHAHVSRKELLRGVSELLRKGYIKRA